MQKSHLDSCPSRPRDPLCTQEQHFQTMVDGLIGRNRSESQENQFPFQVPCYTGKPCWRRWCSCTESPELLLCKDAQGTHKPGVTMPFQQCGMGFFPLKGRKWIFWKTSFFLYFLPYIFTFAHDQDFALDFSYNWSFLQALLGLCFCDFFVCF